MLSKIIVQTYLHNLGMEEELQGVGDEEEREQSCPLQLCLEDTQSGCYVLGAVSETGCSGSSRATSGEYSSSSMISGTRPFLHLLFLTNFTIRQQAQQDMMNTITIPPQTPPRMKPRFSAKYQKE